MLAGTTKFAQASLIALALSLGSTIAQGEDRARTELDVHLWRYDAKTSAMVETRFHVRDGRFVAEPPDERSSARNAARKKLDQETYRRLQDAASARADPLPEGELANALKAVAASKSYGEPPEGRVLSSPDGRYAVLSPRFSHPVVVNVNTLETYRLLDKSDPLEIPMAWSTDSKRVAFAPSEASGNSSVFDVESHARKPAISSEKRWVVALAWSADGKQLASLELANRRLHKSPIGLLAASSGHPDFRNDLVLNVYRLEGGVTAPLKLERNLTEQSNYDYWIEWH